MNTMFFPFFKKKEFETNGMFQSQTAADDRRGVVHDYQRIRTNRQTRFVGIHPVFSPNQKNQQKRNPLCKTKYQVWVVLDMMA
jgi:hypothetical protein